jgi:hypothetical protein
MYIGGIVGIALIVLWLLGYAPARRALMPPPAPQEGSPW